MAILKGREKTIKPAAAGMSALGRKRSPDGAWRRHTEWMLRIVANEGRYFGQPVGQRRANCTAVAEEAEACAVKRLDLGPLLRVLGRRGLEGSPHLMKLAAAVRAGCREIRAWCDLKALAAIKAGVSNQVLRAWHVTDLHGPKRARG